MSEKILVTGGSGFIGSALVRHLVRQTGYAVVAVDKLTYAGSRASVEAVASHPRYRFERADVRDYDALLGIFREHEPAGVFHLAAESHVDRSIEGPAPFVGTNVVGTYHLLEAARRYRGGLPDGRAEAFRFVHVSTDEVFGELGEEGAFTESSAYDPRSPYAASKAASDHLARAWHHTYDLPVIVTHSANNYGPWQYPEKLIPLAILRALRGEHIPVYGDGRNVRDWIHVEDHVRALVRVLEAGEPGERYLIGAREERRVLEVVEGICRLLDGLVEDPAVAEHAELIRFVEDRPGHDFRYALDPSKIERELGWEPAVAFEDGLEATARWYLEHRDWCEEVTRRGG